MNKNKERALIAAGWAVGDAEDFLELTPAERRLVKLRLSVSRAVYVRRLESKLTQKELAKKLNTTQSRIARMERASSDVSLDSMFTGLFTLGGNLKDLGEKRKRATKSRQPRRSTKV
jgi:hypothetical protein